MNSPSFLHQAMHAEHGSPAHPLCGFAKLLWHAEQRALRCESRLIMPGFPHCVRSSRAMETPFVNLVNLVNLGRRYAVCFVWMVRKALKRWVRKTFFSPPGMYTKFTIYTRHLWMSGCAGEMAGFGRILPQKGCFSVNKCTSVNIYEFFGFCLFGKVNIGELADFGSSLMYTEGAWNELFMR